MKGLLEVKIGFAAVPDRGPSGFPALADENVPRQQAKFIQLIVFKWHDLKVSEINIKPAHIDITQVAAWNPSILRLVKHLAEPGVSDSGNGQPRPRGRQRESGS